VRHTRGKESFVGYGSLVCCAQMKVSRPFSVALRGAAFG
jgi:hypothetical protein